MTITITDRQAQEALNLAIIFTELHEEQHPEPIELDIADNMLHYLQNSDEDN